MNRMVPYFDYFSDLSQSQLQQCVYYHQKVVDFYPFQRSEGYQMMGYCYDRLAKPSNALKAFQKAMESNPNYFWPYYNLGLESYKAGQWQRAINYFQQALQTDLRFNIILLAHSKIFLDVRLSNRKNPDYDFLGALREGSENAYIFMMESQGNLKDYKKLFETSMIGLKQEIGDPDIFYFYAAKAAFHLKLYDQSIELLKSSIQNNPNNYEAYLYLGMCMRLVGKEDVAQALKFKADQLHLAQSSAIERRLNSGVRFF